MTFWKCIGPNLWTELTKKVKKEGKIHTWVLPFVLNH